MKKQNQLFNSNILRNKKNIIVFITLLLLSGCTNVNNNVSKKALLVVSFGTSYPKSRELSLDKTANVIAEANPEYDMFISYTSQIIIDVYKDRDNINIFNVDEAIKEIYKSGYGEVLVVPTLVINGEEYDEMMEYIRPFKDKFARLIISKPLLSDAVDYDKVTDVLIQELQVVDDNTAIIYMGHGTPHFANSAYPMLDYVFKHKGLENIYVGTVEGVPSFDNVVNDLKGKGYKNILLLPLMMVAGDHAFNDMAGDEADSWNIMLQSMGYNVSSYLHGIGELNSIQQMFVEHSKLAIEEYSLN